ncbi:Peroxin 13, N-terminal region-domain-containing protein [Geopyxis carbonaria]|nr:Peroxin 13, N-terminal region-domain-containing protein [Geopyxis carbonaria]
MSQVSPPKPWERNATSTIQTTLTPSTLSNPVAMTNPSTTTIQPVSATPTPTASATVPPSLPQRPTSLTNTAAAGPYNRPGYGMGGIGAGLGGGLGGAYGGIGSYGGMGSYTSPYSRFGMGGMGGGMYGGMGGMGGYGGYGMGDPNDPNSLTRGMENSTQATFQMIESIVQAFGGFAQMLESTFMATHSSFFAMVRVAEQVGNLRNTLGSILGIFTIIRWAKIALAKITGRPLPASAGDLTAANFASFEGRSTPGTPPRPSKKPFFFFVAAVFGLPYLMGKLIRSLAAKQEQEERKRMAETPGQQMDPSKLEFCRVMFDFTPEAQNGIELEVKKGDLVAVLSKADPMGNPSQWWRCRARDSRVGYLPSPYLESIQRKDQAGQKQLTTGGGESRTSTMTSEALKQAIGDGKPSDISIESFQKSQFNS